MSSWVILAFRGVIVLILLTLIANLSLLMSHSLKIPPSSPLQRVLPFRMSYLFLLSYHLPISLLHLQMLCLDHFRFIFVVLVLLRPLVESSSMPQSSPAPVPQPYDDLPIAIRKDTCSTSNPHPVYNFLSFHRLSYPTLPLFPHRLLSLPLKALVRLSFIRARNKQ